MRCYENILPRKVCDKYQFAFWAPLFQLLLCHLFNIIKKRLDDLVSASKDKAVLEERTPDVMPKESKHEGKSIMQLCAVQCLH